jgi:hypothetical protein
MDHVSKAWSRFVRTFSGPADRDHYPVIASRSATAKDLPFLQPASICRDSDPEIR